MALAQNLIWFVFFIFFSEIFPISQKEIKQLQIGQNIFEMFKETKKKYKYLIYSVQKLGFVFKNLVLCSTFERTARLLFSAQVVLAACVG